ncbi:MAG: PCP reductase family protein [Deltaproteobacteria bacterium]|nr:PCP reductase family protein [Deltaproteobacteria bacterium]
MPFFVRKRVRKKVEEQAAASKASEVTVDHIQSCLLGSVRK